MKKIRTRDILAKLAVGKLAEVSDDEWAAIPYGDLDVDYLLRLTGTLKINEDVDAVLQPKVDPWRLLYVLLRETPLDMTKAVKEALKLSAKADAKIDGLKDQVRELAQANGKTSAQHRRGQVRFIGTMKRVSKKKLR